MALEVHHNCTAAMISSEFYEVVEHTDSNAYQATREAVFRTAVGKGRAMQAAALKAAGEPS